MLSIPKTEQPEIHFINGKKYLVAELTEKKITVNEMVLALRRGEFVLCPMSKRGWLTGKLKVNSIFTRQETINGDWVMFTPCPKREFKA